MSERQLLIDLLMKPETDFSKLSPEFSRRLSLTEQIEIQLPNLMTSTTNKKLIVLDLVNVFKNTPNLLVRPA